MRLRDVEPGDVAAYIRMRCDPAMTRELGGPRSPDSMEDKVRRDVADVVADRAWIWMIVDGECDADDAIAGTVTLYRRDDGRSEIGWMVLPEHQGRGLGKAAVRAMLARWASDARWGPVHAFPAITNAPSNGICRATGFVLVGVEDVDYAGQVFRVNHWVFGADQ